MRTGDICTRNPVFVDREASVQQAAAAMRELHVGDLVVVDGAENCKRPVGMVTDRDIVLAVVAPRLDASVFTVGDIMTDHVVTASAEQDVFDTVHTMRLRGVRRVPVVDKDGELQGIFAMDDFIGLVAREMDEIAKLIGKERDREARTRV
jgi:CBS domain-containing protein